MSEASRIWNLAYSTACAGNASDYCLRLIQQMADDEGVTIQYPRCTPPVATADAVKQAQKIMDYLGSNITGLSFGKTTAQVEVAKYLAAALTAAFQRGYEQAREDGLNVITYDSIMAYMIADEVDGFTVGAVIGRSRKLLRALTPAPSSPTEVDYKTAEDRVDAWLQTEGKEIARAAAIKEWEKREAAPSSPDEQKQEVE